MLPLDGVLFISCFESDLPHYYSSYLNREYGISLRLNILLLHVLVTSFKTLIEIGFVCAVDVLKPTNVDKLPSDLEGMEASMERLLALIDDVYKYVDDVVVSRCL